MSDHLLLLTLGPVQDFIAAARRTRDLWFGSHLLSELAKAAAKSLANQGATLIFPALEPGSAELKPVDAPVDDQGQPPLSVANKILAVVPAGRAPEDLAREAREAARRRLDELADKARENAAGLLADGIDDVWREQLATALECAAAWTPFAADTYDTARQELEQTLAGRKNLREFGQWEARRPGAPKSSLDGARESVLRERDRRDKKKSQQFRLADNEQLDALGVLKRCGGDPDQFVPLRNVAVADWLQQASDELLQTVIRECRNYGQLPRVERTLPCAKPFGYDADVLFPDRWPALVKELGPKLPEPLRDAIQGLIRQIGGPPFPYVCCLHADGDKMGEALNQLKTPDDHRGFSTQLAGFAPAARDIVESDTHRGVLVYAGGDDVLAFLPVSTAVACADALQIEFVEIMKDYSGPTLSVGLGIGHTLTGMGDLLDLARRAEKLAKRKRNSLAVIVDKRSGGADEWTACWSTAPANQLEEAQQCLAEKLPTKKVSELRARLMASPAADDTKAGAAWADTLRGEARRILCRSHGGEVIRDITEFKLTLPEGGDYKAVREAVEEWVSRMRLALTLRAAKPWEKEVQS